MPLQLMSLRTTSHGPRRLMLLNVAWAAMLWLIANPACSKTIELVVLAGQSNMVGVGASPRQLDEELRKPQPDVLFRYWTSHGKRLEWHPLCPQPYGFGPEISLGAALAKDARARANQLAIVKIAFGGTAIAESAEQRPAWHPALRGTQFNNPDPAHSLGPEVTPPTSHHFERMQSAINEAIESLRSQGAVVRVTAFFWMQGESDSLYAETAQQYGQHFRELIEAVRQEWGESLPIVFGRIRHRGTRGTNGGAPVSFHVSAVRQGMQSLAVRDPSTLLVSIDDFNTSDGVHFRDHQATFGLRLHKAYQWIARNDVLYDSVSDNDFLDGEWRISGGQEHSVVCDLVDAGEARGAALRVSLPTPAAGQAPSKGTLFRPIAWRMPPGAVKLVEMNMSVAEGRVPDAETPQFQFAIRQAGRNFVAAPEFRSGKPFEMTERLGLGLTGLTAQSFSAVDGQQPRHPDFSSDGGAMEFGLQVSHIDDGERASVGLFDDFTVDLYYQTQTSSVR